MATCHISISAKLIATKFDKALACDIESPHIKAHDPLITGSYVRTQNRRCAACTTLLSLNVSWLTNHKAMQFERGDFPVKNNQRNVQIISTWTYLQFQLTWFQNKPSSTMFSCLLYFVSVFRADGFVLFILHCMIAKYFLFLLCSFL